jgi:hypothetical protein
MHITLQHPSLKPQQARSDARVRHIPKETKFSDVSQEIQEVRVNDVHRLRALY